jgi:uncharacterized protein (DUF952 family)
MSSIIYHITTLNHWQDFKDLEFFIDESHLKDGFIHCSTKDQLEGVLSRFYTHITDALVLLIIDVEKLHSRLAWEKAEATEELFPHVYGLIAHKAIIDSQVIREKKQE